MVMEITKTEFEKLFKEFKEDFYLVECGPKVTDLRCGTNILRRHKHKYVIGGSLLEGYVKEHLRKPEAKLDKMVCDTTKVYTLSEDYDGAEKIMVRQNIHGHYNLYVEKEDKSNITFEVNDIIQASSCKEAVESLGYEVRDE